MQSEDQLLPPNSVQDLLSIHYGDNRRSWHPKFVEYMDSIVNHHNYKGMPCTRDSKGKIDWTIPSNRQRGSKNWDGNQQRRDWWKSKAEEIGIPVEGHWLSAVAKTIHPFRKKPCQTCGRVMEIAYVYPNKTTLALIAKKVPFGFDFYTLGQESIFDLLERLKIEFGASSAVAILGSAFPLLKSSSSVDDARELLQSEYVHKESRRLSPGVMSNAPDRLDGFHTYNLCCRSKEDTGRSRENLDTYGVDRRAYEQWSEGDWAVADLVMAQAGTGICASCSKVGPISADHIGPISLGFAHTTIFRPLCYRCNSAKNNKMSLLDVTALRNYESSGEKVASWQILSLWNEVKSKILTDQDAAQLSKLLRILQHHYLISLLRAITLGSPDVLLPLIQIEHAYKRIDLVGFNAADLTFQSVSSEHRQDKYALSRASRTMRIAFDALLQYGAKPHRNIQSVSDERIESYLTSYEDALISTPTQDFLIRDKLSLAISVDAPAKVRDDTFAEVVLAFNSAKKIRDPALGSLKNLMAAYADVLCERWERGITVAWDDFEPDN